MSCNQYNIEVSLNFAQQLEATLYILTAHQVIQTLPEVLGHQAEGAQKRPAEVVEVGVAKVGVVADVRNAYVEF